MSPTFSSLNLVLLGHPGSGKGTQARALAERYTIPHISTGALLRGEIRCGSKVGNAARDKMERGGLVSDALMQGLVLERLDREDCARGFLLHGYPRNLEQAKVLDDLLAELGRSLERVVLLSMPGELASERLPGRRVHEPSGRIYHLDCHPPKVRDIDDLTGEPLTRRADDNNAALFNRIGLYRDQTLPVIDMYRRRGLLTEVDGSLSAAEVTEAVLQVIGAPVCV